MAQIEPNPYSQPTTWNFNPLANTSLVIDYTDSNTTYGSTTQPYGNYAEKTSLVTWKNATSWQSSLVSGATQQYYGGPTEVPLYAAPTTWYANATPENEAGQYAPQDNAYANLWPYDGTIIPTYGDANYVYSDSKANYSNANQSLVYDSSTREYDGGNAQSFANWKNATAWTPIAPGAL